MPSQPKHDLNVRSPGIPKQRAIARETHIRTSHLQELKVAWRPGAGTCSAARTARKSSGGAARNIRQDQVACSRAYLDGSGRVETINDRAEEKFKLWRGLPVVSIPCESLHRRVRCSLLSWPSNGLT